MIIRGRLKLLLPFSPYRSGIVLIEDPSVAESVQFSNPAFQIIVREVQVSDDVLLGAVITSPQHVSRNPQKYQYLSELPL